MTLRQNNSCPSERAQAHQDRKTWQVKSQEHALWSQGDCEQRIHPKKPHNQFHILWWLFEKVQNYDLKFENNRTDFALWQYTLSHFHVHQDISDQKQKEFSSSTLLILFGTLWLRSIPHTENKLERPSVPHNWDDIRRKCSCIWTPSKNVTFRIHLENDRITEINVYVQNGEFFIGDDCF